jgi:hypothetical protein
LRTLVIATGVVPPVFAAVWFVGAPALILMALSAVTYFWDVDDSSSLVGIGLRLAIFLFTMFTLARLLGLALA